MVMLAITLEETRLYTTVKHIFKVYPIQGQAGCGEEITGTKAPDISLYSTN